MQKCYININMVNILGIFFIILVIMYMVANWNTLVYLDVVMIALGIAILGLTILKSNRPVEFFSQTQEPDFKNFQPISMEEDYATIIPKYSIYLTMFNKSSYPESGNEWINVAYKEPLEECKRVNNKKFMFENTPIFSKKGGIMMGTNRLFGPYSNNLNISLQSTFTIYFTCKHGDFVHNPGKEIELLKLYANSSDNNGLAFFIEGGSIAMNNNVQSGNLKFKFTDTDNTTTCLLNAADTSFTFDKINISMYFIVKDVDKIRILYMLGGSSVINQIALINIQETNSTFSNKELIINRFQNWKGSLYQLGVIPEAISDNNVSNIYKHSYSEYQKATNQDFLDLTNDYNAILDQLKNYTNCPYDQTVCSTCNTVTKWNDMNQVIASPIECKDAINTFCKINTKHPLCKCWDTTYSGYQTDSCKLYRNIYSPQGRIYDNITQDDLLYIKEKYNLLKLEDCPKTTGGGCVNEKLIKNTYTEYDFDKLKIKPRTLGLDDDDIDIKIQKKIESPYDSEPTSVQAKKEKEAAEAADKKEKASSKNRGADKDADPDLNHYTYKPVVVNSGATKFADRMQAYRVDAQNGNTIKNIYQTDPNIKFDEKNNTALKELQKDTSQETTSSPLISKIMSYFLPS